MTRISTKQDHPLSLVGVALLVVLLLPVIVCVIVLYLLVGFLLHVAVWVSWCVRGKYILFVYSNSPIWHDYLREGILPRLGRRAVILNWSERSRWRCGLAEMVFRYFGGSRKFNPLAVAFRPFRIARRFRFYEPFRDFKHGKREAVQKMEDDLLAFAEECQTTRAA